jgi:hypothetical protein
VPLQPGQALPAFRLTAAVSGRTVSDAELGKGRGVLIVHGSKSAEAAKELSKAVRSRWPQSSDVFLASIVDLRPFSGVWKKVAEAQLKSTYDKLAQKAKEAGLDPAGQVLICPDWDAAVAKTLGVIEPDKEPAAIVVRDGKVVAVVSGSALAERVVASLS